MSDWADGNWGYTDDFYQDVDWTNNLDGSQDYFQEPDFSNTTDYGPSFNPQYFGQPPSLFEQAGLSPDSMYGIPQAPDLSFSQPYDATNDIMQMMSNNAAMEGPWKGDSQSSWKDYAGLLFGLGKMYLDYNSSRKMEDAYTRIAGQQQQAAASVKSPPFNQLRYDYLTTDKWQQSPMFQQMLRDFQRNQNTRMAGNRNSGMGTLLNSGMVTSVLEKMMSMIPDENNAAYTQLLQGSMDPQVAASRSRNSNSALMFSNLKELWRILNQPRGNGSPGNTSGEPLGKSIFGDLFS